MAILSETIPIGEWLPDRADLENGGCLVALNVTTDGEDYKPFNAFAAQSDALPSKCYGGYSHVASDGTVTTFAATREKIYKLNGASWDDVTNTGADYTTTQDGSWFFTQFGDRVIATNYVDKIQTFLVGTDTEFSDLITTGPDVKCRNFGIINNFLVAIDINDDTGVIPNRVRWSPINDPGGDWTPSQSTMSDYQNCEDGNPGQGVGVISGQNFGVLLFKNASYRMDFVGPPNIFSITLIESGRGPINAQAWAVNGSDLFMYTQQGFFQSPIGGRSFPIGHRKVDKYFKDDIDVSFTYNIRSGADPINKNILFAYTSVEGNGQNDKILCFNWADQKFTQIEQAIDHVMPSFSSGFTLEDIGAEYPDIETVPYSFDSAYWTGGNLLLAGVSGNQLGYFQGEPLDGYLESQESRLNNDGLAYVQSVLPVFEGGDCQVRIGERRLINGSVNYSPYQTADANTGEVNFDNESRYHRAGIMITGEWKHFQGIRFRAEPGSPI